MGDLNRVKGILNKEGSDNDPKHSSKLNRNYLGKKQSAGILSLIEWPAQSPDLNLSETLRRGYFVRLLCQGLQGHEKEDSLPKAKYFK